MPVTPYHAGPSGLLGLLLRRWADVPVFLAANVLIDVEVIADQRLAPGWPVHQLWHFHTLLIGGLAGALFGAAVYGLKPLRRASEKGMTLLGLPGRASLRTMTLGGLLGAWTHVLTDSFYHSDVQLFWPYARNPVYAWMGRGLGLGFSRIHEVVETACLAALGLAVVVYVGMLIWRMRQKADKP